MANVEDLRSPERVQAFARSLRYRGPQQLKRVRAIAAQIRAVPRKRTK